MKIRIGALAKIGRFLLTGLSWLLGLSLAKSKRTLAENEKASLTVLIPAYNEADVIAKCLAALQKQSLKPERIVVIDDGSEDETAKVAEESGAEVIRLVKPSGSKAKAINFALNAIKLQSMYLAVVDADTVLEKNALKRALERFDSPKVAAVCGYVLSGQTETFWQKARFIEYLVGGVADKASQEWWGTPLIMAGCFTVLRTDLFMLLGGFQERTITEDLDLTWTLVEKGYRVVYATESRCWTIDPQNFKQFRAQLLRWRRGFLQNLGLHWPKLIKNPRMMFFILWWLAGGALVMPFFFALQLYLLITLQLGWLAVLIGGEILYTGLVSAIQCARLGYPLKLSLYALHYWLVKPVSLIIFWEALVRELGELFGRPITKRKEKEFVWKKTRQKGEITMYQPTGLPIGHLLRFPLLAILTVALLAVPHQVAQEFNLTIIGELPQASITFTFDDGWRSVYDRALSVLKECGAVGTVFVVTGYIGYPAYMSWQQLSELYSQGWEIASHTVSHTELTQLSSEQIKTELVESKLALENHGFKVFSFASPSGLYNEDILEAVRQVYLAHRTIDPGINYRPIDPYRIKAFDVEKHNLSLDQIFELILEAKRSRGHIVLVFHKIDEEEPYTYPSWKLQAICQYARSQGFELFKTIPQ